jgi:hypothetical protein
MFIANLSVAETLDSLKTTEQGLTNVEAQRRLIEFGYNRLEVVKQKSILLRFLGVILINGIFSFWQEYRAERAISALTKLLPQQALVLRDGQLQPILAEMLVPGDCIVLEEGDNVPADCRLIYAAGVRINISTVTGESLPMARTAEAVTDNIALNAKNLLLAGTSVVSGQCRAVIFATGRHTEFGQIAHLTQTEKGSISHLQLEIARLSKLVAGFAATLGIIFFGIGTLLGLPFWDNLMFAIGIIVANVPEGDETHDFFGWATPGFGKFSVSHSFPAWLMGKNKEYVIDARIKGGKRAMIMSNEYDSVFPMDIMPEYLLKAIIAFDIDKMENLGIYEVAPEDFALCEFVDTSKLEIQKIVRQGLDVLYKEMN